LLAAFVGEADAANAQQATSAPDGQSFKNQSRLTQDAFMATFGPACAQQEWVWQHTLAVNADWFGGEAATDGQAFSDQDDDTQLPFIAWFGPHAATEWVYEHNAVLAHRVVPDAVAPVPCPPAKTTRVGDVIGTTHLSSAVASAKDGDYRGAFGSFSDFKVIWGAAKAKVASKSSALAQTVQDAVDQANGSLGDPKAPAPAKTQYYPPLQNLLGVVRGANATLAIGGTTTANAGAPSPASAGPPPQIKTGNLGEAVDWANKGNLASTRGEFGQFQDDWSSVKDAVRAVAPLQADRIDAAIGQLQAVIGDTSQSPAQSQYQPLIQNLQKLVQDANASLAS
jgi:hypothetical protein